MANVELECGQIGRRGHRDIGQGDGSIGIGVFQPVETARSKCREQRLTNIRAAGGGEFVEFGGAGGAERGQRLEGCAQLRAHQRQGHCQRLGAHHSVEPVDQFRPTGCHTAEWRGGEIDSIGRRGDVGHRLGRAGPCRKGGGPDKCRAHGIDRSCGGTQIQR